MKINNQDLYTNKMENIIINDNMPIIDHLNISDDLIKLNNDVDIKAHYDKNDFYLFNKIVGLCIRKGEKKKAIRNVSNAFLLIKKFFNINAIFFLKLAVVRTEPYIFLSKISRGNKITIFPRILPGKIRLHNALYIIVKHAFNTTRSYRNFHFALANSIIMHSMPDNKYKEETKQNIEIAEMNKRNVRLRKKTKKKNKKIMTKIRRRERFRLIIKIKTWK